MASFLRPLVMTVFVPGQRFISEAEPELGLGQVLEVSGRNITLEFQAAATTREELEHVRAEVAGGDVVQAVDQRVFGLPGEQAVDEWRPAVADRMPDHAVLIRCIHGEYV